MIEKKKISLSNDNYLYCHHQFFVGILVCEEGRFGVYCYTYALNNPLIYTDPDGEFIHLIIGAVIGGVINLAMNAKRIDNFWQALGYFGIGAAAGALGAGVGAGISSAIAGGSFGAGFVGSSAAMTASSSFVSGAAIGGGAGFSSGFTTGFGNGLMYGQSFGQALGSGLVSGTLGSLSGATIGGLVGGFSAMKDGRAFFDGFDYQKTLDNYLSKEGINNPNSKWLVANKKNAQLVNDTYNTSTKVTGNRIYLTPNEYSKYGVNYGTQSKGNITLITKQAIRNKAFFDITDIIRHESVHQLQILSGMNIVRTMEIQAYMANILNPATSTTVQRVSNILLNDWGFDVNIFQFLLRLRP